MKNEIVASFTLREFRLLLDLVYAGNWVLNSIREDDRIAEYDDLESKVFLKCGEAGLDGLVDTELQPPVPSAEYVDGGIHEAILDYEDAVFYSILAEELARRDLRDRDVDGADSDLLAAKIELYMTEFTQHGVDNVRVNGL